MKNDLLKLKATLAGLISARSLLTKMVAAFLILIIMPVSTIGIITTNRATKDLMEQMEDSISASTVQTSNCFDLFFDKADSISLQVHSNAAIQEYSTATDAATLAMLYRDANSFISGLNAAAKELNVKVIFDSGNYFGDVKHPLDIDAVRGSGGTKSG